MLWVLKTESNPAAVTVPSDNQHPSVPTAGSLVSSNQTNTTIEVEDNGKNYLQPLATQTGSKVRFDSCQQVYQLLDVRRQKDNSTSCVL